MSAAFYTTVDALRQRWVDDGRQLIDHLAVAVDEDRELDLWEALLTTWILLDAGQRADLAEHARHALGRTDARHATRKLAGIAALDESATSGLVDLDD